MQLGHYLLKYDTVYDVYQSAVGGIAYRARIVETLNSIGKPIFLDLGCGTATIAEKLDESVKYIGIDSSQNYLSKAQRSFPNHKFLQDDLGKDAWCKTLEGIGSATASGLGLLHHLNDSEAKTFLESCRKVLNPDSLLFTVDPVIVDDTGHVATWFAKNDRGQFLRTPHELQNLFELAGFNSSVTVKKKQFRIPLDTVEILAHPV